MNIYEFIDSKAIRRHCEKIGHKFSSLQTAFLIWQSRTHTVTEKHKAWNEIIKTMPDCVIERRPNCPHFDSLHGFLRQYMAMENGLLKKFFESETNYVFCFDKMWFPEWHYFSPNGYYKNRYFGYQKAEKLYFDFSVGLEAENNTVQNRKEVFDHYCVMKQKITTLPEQELQTVTVKMNIRGEPLCVDEQGYFTDDEWEIFNAFEGMWIDVPTPFVPGDVVYTDLRFEGFCPDPFVLTSLCTDRTTEHDQKLYNAHLRVGDTSDMTAYGYRIFDDRGHLYHECDHDYLHLEYFTEPLTGIRRTLFILGKFIKKEKVGEHKTELSVSKLMVMYHEILREAGSFGYDTKYLMKQSGIWEGNYEDTNS